MNSNINILVVEDNEDINKLLYSILIKEGYNVRCTYSGTEAMMCLEQYKYDLVLLDLMLPGVSGENIIKEIRKVNFMPIIVISAKTKQDDRLNALKIGADDFIVKPFDVEEVLVRVNVQLRRYKDFSPALNSNNKILYREIELNNENRQVFVNEIELIVTSREFDILYLLINNPNKVFTRANLFESVWKDNFLGDYNTVNVHISNLRAKLSKLTKEEYIQTVWGIGFKLK